MTGKDEMKRTVLEFVERINARDVEGILGLMADDYVFVNSSGDRFTGRAFMRETWRSQFANHPDFRIRVHRVVADDEGVGVFGWSEGTYSPDGVLCEENRWEVPAAFFGIARSGKMTHWQVFSDASIVFDLIQSRSSPDSEKE